MRVYSSWLERPVACVVLLLLLGSTSQAATQTSAPAPAPTPQASTPVPPKEAPPQGNETGAGATPKSTGPAEAAPHSPDAVPAKVAKPTQEPSTPQTSVPDQPPSRPVGSAVAPDMHPEGVPASRPAGASIAPGKQRRARSFSIRVALLVGAGIAIGTVAAASLATSSRPH